MITKTEDFSILNIKDVNKQFLSPLSNLILGPMSMDFNFLPYFDYYRCVNFIAEETLSCSI